MKPLSGAAIFLILHTSLCIPNLSAEAREAAAQQLSQAAWTSAHVQHVYGFPDAKPNKKGTLTLGADTLTFSSKSGTTSIPRSLLTAASAGNQRVEIWGVGGRILRMTIPDGGGLAAAAFMHHRVDMLTVEFKDAHGGAHSAVFVLPAKQAEIALSGFALPATRAAASFPSQQPPSQKSALSLVASETSCGTSVERNSVLISEPDWGRAEVPAAYRALVYEHIVDRFRKTKDVGRVYRDGEQGAGCPQYIVHISVMAFKQGSSVKRAALGPIGFFVGTTQMKFDATFTRATGSVIGTEQIKATIRGESESTNVADHLAKSLAKRYTAAVERSWKLTEAKS
ncbi:hypothetical protein HDF16_001732 [Granulicella aggregans]|uniref:DUF4410 domain-containing protein n=1 Tax=Granulicella aggregans TaxID=474949 RepID=A0A7W8E2Z8_9BACT|nr:hypothetical protein [Granulicella aggregans]MBB5057047.1 hypothetical protein [Granulicella aggregans]